MNFRKMQLRAVAVAAAAMLVAGFAVPASAAGGALALVPADATTVGMARVSDMRTSAITGRLFTETDKSIDGEAARFMREAGLKPTEDVDVAVVSLTPDASGEPRVLVGFEGRFDPVRLAQAVVARGAVAKRTSNGTYFLLPEESSREGEHPTVSFVNARLVIAGHEASVAAALAAHKSGGTTFARTALGREIGAVDPGATSWLVVDVQRAQRFKSSPNFSGSESGKGEMIANALKTVSFVNVWAKDSGDSMTFSATARTADAETRELIEDTARGLLSGWRLAVQEKAPELVSVIRKFSVERDSQGVTLSGTIPAEMIKTLSAKKQASK